MIDALKNETFSNLKPLLNNFEILTESVQEIKLQFGTKLEQISENNQRIEFLLELLLNKFNLLDGKLQPNQKKEEIKTPVIKLNENKTANEIQMLKAEIYKLREEKNSLKKKQNSQFYQKSKSKVKDFESFQIENLDESFDNFGIIKTESNKKRVREFRLDSNQNSNLNCFGQFNQAFVSSKDSESDVGSIKTSKGNNKESQKYSQLPNLLTDKFHFSFLNPKQVISNKISQMTPSREEELISKGHSFDSENNFRQSNHSIEQNIHKNRNENKNMSIKKVKNFVDFQRILRDLKLTLNTGIYSQFDDKIEEKIQQLNSMLSKYKENDSKINEFCHLIQKKIKESDQLNRKFNQSLSKEIRMNDNSNKDTIDLGLGLIKLENLKTSSNYGTYEAKIIQIQNNPSEFESFLFNLKREIEKRESLFFELKNKIEGEN